MTQNTSPAVMAQRVEARDSLEDFPTPSWGTRALMEHILFPRFAGGPASAWEPTCNRGYMVRALGQYFEQVFSSDVHPYGDFGYFLHDFLQPYLPPFMDGGVDWIITNPPFRLGPQFIARAREVAKIGCAMLVRTAFLEGADRYRELFNPTPPTIVAQFVERIVLTKGIVRDPSKKYWDKTAQKWRRPSTATAYAWLVWVHGAEPLPFQWIPPCRRRLERKGDYPEQ